MLCAFLAVRKGNGGQLELVLVVMQENTVIHAQQRAKTAKGADTRIKKNRVPANLVQRASTKIKEKKKVARIVILVSIPTNLLSKVARTVPVDNTRIKGGNPRAMTAHQENGKMTVENIIAKTAIVGNTRTNPVRPRV
jgi:hypothetical protein